MHRECRERFPRHRIQRKPLVRDPGMHHGTRVTHVPWCMLRLLIHGGGKTFPAFPVHMHIRNFTYMARAPYPCVRHQLPNISLFVDNSARTWYRHISLCRTKYSYCKCGVEWWYKTTDKNNDYHNPYINVCTVSNVDRARNFSIYPEIFHNQRDQTWAGFKYDGVEQSGARSLDLHMTSKTKLYLS